MQCIPIRDLKNTAAISEMCKKSADPIFVTKNGYNDMVIMSAEVYDRIRLVSVYEKLMEAETDIEEGRVLEASASLRKLRERYGLQYKGYRARGKHGILFKTNTGVELLIHIGLDTMKLNGKYFKSHVSNGTEVNLGDLLLEFDINSLNKEGYNLITPIVVTNIDNYIKAVPMLSEKEEVKILDNILTIV